MNIAGLLLPKSIVAYLYDDFTLRQALEKMRYHGYTHLPVITRDNRYYGTISEGDLLWYFMDAGTIDLAKCQETRIRDALTLKHYPPVPIDMNIPEVVDLLVSYNFLPVVDDRDSFVGIVTRNKILKKLSDANHGDKKVTTTISYGNPSLFTPNI
ncbi:MAG: CBS domain-containing protein [Clostridia bacterium]|nr:CBS domain-containing protein [Clostridia bacterium]MBP3555074.1 CBS domain-containing protein [Clostridia bacterium]